MVRRISTLLILGFTFGAIVGFAGTLASSRSDIGLEGHGEFLWSALFALPSLPGWFITWVTNGAYDWCIGEQWDFVLPITLWNGVVWSLTFVVIGVIRHWLSSTLVKRNPALPAPAN